MTAPTLSDAASRPVSWRRNARATLNALAAAALAAVAFAVVGGIVLISGAAVWSLATGPGGVSHGVQYAGGLVLAPILLLWAIQGFADIQRARIGRTLGVEIARPTTNNRRWPIGPWRSATTWRAFAFHLAAVVVGVLGGVAVLACLLAPLAFFWLAVISQMSLLVLIVGELVALTLAAVAGPFAVIVAGWDLAIARTLLGPSRSDELARQVESLARSRADILDATDAERRRIERDLHDGAQQRLVSLAMNLGIAHATMTDAPEPARRAIAEAQEEALLALAEMRALVRGLHPAVLDDRGLDAALSGLVARTPVPIRLAVDVPDRCSPTVEAVAYFIVSEALTNVAKHSSATTAEVTVARTGDRIRIVVSDDGRGGATPTAGGSGLRGLAQRAASVDGTLTVDSPTGGPTIVTAELPCES
jgi:signal transduction histidine kinase